LPGKDGLNTLDPTLAELLKPLEVTNRAVWKKSLRRSR
jgi:hypothetical protein